MHPTLFLLPALVSGSLAWAALDDLAADYREGTLGKTRQSMAELCLTGAFYAAFVIAIAPPMAWLVGVVL
jgi:hypothetical protein